MDLAEYLISEICRRYKFTHDGKGRFRAWGYADVGCFEERGIVRLVLDEGKIGDAFEIVGKNSRAVVNDGRVELAVNEGEAEFLEYVKLRGGADAFVEAKIKEYSGKSDTIYRAALFNALHSSAIKPVLTALMCLSRELK